MSASDLLTKATEFAKKMTPNDRLVLLKKAHILDDNGIFDSRFFSQKTIDLDLEKTRKLKKR